MPSVNIEMGVMLGIPIMHCSHPNINLCLSFLRINNNKGIGNMHCMINKSGLFMSEYVRA